MKKLLCFLSLAAALFVAPSRAADVAAKQPVIAFIIGENEYHTWETLPAFAKTNLEPRGIICRYVNAPPASGNDFTNYTAIKDADLIFVSARRRAPQKEMMDLIRAHAAAGKPVVGIRTASHAFAPTANAATDAQHDAWPTWDADVLGGDYQNHYNNQSVSNKPTVLQIVAENTTHPILTGIPSAGFNSDSNLYKNPKPKPTVTVLLRGNFVGNADSQPVAWINTAANRRVFYTSLGAPEDFANPEFRRLLQNGILWALNQKVN